MNSSLFVGVCSYLKEGSNRNIHQRTCKTAATFRRPSLGSFLGCMESVLKVPILSFFLVTVGVQPIVVWSSGWASVTKAAAMVWLSAQ